MNAKVEQNSSPLANTAKLALALLVLVGGVFAYYWFSDAPTAVRALELAAVAHALPLSALVAQIDVLRIAADEPPNLASALRSWLFAARLTEQDLHATPVREDGRTGATDEHSGMAADVVSGPQMDRADACDPDRAAVAVGRRARLA